MTTIPATIKPQAGMAMLFCMLFLTALTLLGLSASADAVLQNQLAANLQETERAKQSALATLSWVEDWLFTLQGSAPPVCTSPCKGLKFHQPGDLLLQPALADLAWWQAQGYEAGIDPLTGDRLETLAASSIDPPMWVIEVVQEKPLAGEDTGEDPLSTQVWYRIVARGSGHTSSTLSVVESVVTRIWPADEEVPKANQGRVTWRQL